MFVLIGQLQPCGKLVRCPSGTRALTKRRKISSPGSHTPRRHADVVHPARPALPYDALQPYMSRETLEFHHDKHHAAYVNTGNNLLEGPNSRARASRRS